MRLLREPLLHFALAGAALFAAHAWLQRGEEAERPPERVVRITAGDLQWLAEGWVRQWHRPPTRPELSGLLSDFLREELLSREARELGLDDGDMVVRRRLAQKMTFLIEGTSRVALEPTETQLRTYFDAHADDFVSPARLSFEHAFFNRDTRGDRADSDARAALQGLRADPPATGGADVGDRLLIPAEIEDVDAVAVSSQFGEAFARAVFELEAGVWQGPVESGYGLHLVRVGERREPRRPQFEDVRDRVRDEWARTTQETIDEQYFAALLQKYELQADAEAQELVGPLVRAAAAEAPH